MIKYLMMVFILFIPMQSNASPALIAVQKAGLATSRFLQAPAERIRLARVGISAHWKKYKFCKKRHKLVKRRVIYGQARLRRIGRASSRRLAACMN